MNKRQTNNFFIPTSSNGVSTALSLEQQNRRTGYYQYFINALLTRRIGTIEGIEQLARQIAAVARQAHLAKDIETVERAIQIILALPVSEKLRTVALYYEALCIKRRGHIEEARQSLEHVVEVAIPEYKARALQNIGATYYERGEVDTALPFYLAAGKVAADFDPVTVVESQCMVAIVRYAHGDYKSGVASMEGLFPLVHGISKFHPPLYYAYLNNLAVGLAEAGRITEAHSAIFTALSSPFAEAYPEWSETCQEIEQKRNYPDSSRCFIERSLTESEAIPDSTINTSVEADSSPKTQRETEQRRVRRLTVCPFVGQLVYQISSTLPNSDKAIIPEGSAQSILQQLGRSVQPRGPPASTQRKSL